jgi:hypothetical protein
MFLHLLHVKFGSFNEDNTGNFDKGTDGYSELLDYCQPSQKDARYTLLQCPLVAKLVAKIALHSHHATKDYHQASTSAYELLQLPIDERFRDDECELLYGRTGFISAILYVRSLLGDESYGSDVIKRELVKIIQQGMEVTEQSETDVPLMWKWMNESYGSDVIKSELVKIIQQGMEVAEQSETGVPLMWEWMNTYYLGAAHGVIGILYTLLCCQESELEEASNSLKVDVKDLIRQTIKTLEEDHLLPSGNLDVSVVTSKNDRLVHWCHGAPGFVMLLWKAYEVFQDATFLRKAETLCKEVVYPRGLLRKGVGLCHGISGNAYSFLSVYRARLLEDKEFPVLMNQRKSRNEETQSYLQKAKNFANFAIDNLPSLEPVPENPYSLFEGIGGLSFLLLDLIKPENSRFPCFEI